MKVPLRNVLVVLLLGVVTGCSALDQTPDTESTPVPSVALTPTPSPTPSPTPTVLTLPQARAEFRRIFQPTLLAIGTLSKAINHKPRDWRAVRSAAGVVAAREKTLATQLRSIRWPARSVDTANTLAQAVSQHLVQFRRLAAAKTRTEVNQQISRLKPSRDLRALIKRFRAELGFPTPTARPGRS